VIVKKELVLNLENVPLDRVQFLVKRSTKKRVVKRSTKKRVVKRSTKKRSVKKSGRTKLNKWQSFLHKHRGMGHSLRTLRAKYRKEVM
jgi:hypothetical protein